MEKRIVAVVVTYNRKELLCECLDALLGQTVPVGRIVVVNNASTDGTLDLIAERGFATNSKVEILNLPNNVGGAGGFYAGMKLAREIDWCTGVWIMDDDTIPTSTCLEELLKAASLLKGRYSFLASSVYGPNGEYMNVPTVDTRTSSSGYVDWYQYLKDGLVAVREATFVSLLINRKALESCGLPCKDFFIWGDDTEYTTRLVRHCDRAYMVGSSVVMHKRNGGKTLSWENETNPQRIRFFSLQMRNSATILLYYNGWHVFFNYEKQCMKRCLSLLLRGRISQAAIIVKSIFMLARDYRHFRDFINKELKRGACE